MADQDMSPQRGPDAHSDEWYGLREYRPDSATPVVFGASEAAAACGASKYGSPLQLYLERRKEIPAWQPDEEQAERMLMGQLLEPVILNRYKDKEQCELQTGLPFFFHSLHPFMGATPDGLAKRPDAHQWCVDAKNVNWRMFDSSGESDDRWGEPGTDQVPMEYFFQAQQQMAVMNTGKVDFPVLKNGNQFLIYTVWRAEPVISQIVACEQELAERIINGDPPEPDMQHAETKRLLTDLYGEVLGEGVDLPIEADAIMDVYHEAKRQEKEAAAMAADAYNRLLWHLKDAPSGMAPSGRRVKRTLVRESFVSQKDVEELARRVGGVKRKGYVRLTIGKK